MIKYYTRACNFYYGSISKEKIKKKLSLPLNGNDLISFDSIEIITRKFKKKIHIKEIKKQNINIKKKTVSSNFHQTFTKHPSNISESKSIVGW